MHKCVSMNAIDTNKTIIEYKLSILNKTSKKSEVSEYPVLTFLAKHQEVEYSSLILGLERNMYK